MLVDHAHRVGVEQLAARNRHAHLDDLDGGVHGVGQAVKRAGGGHHRLGQRVKLDRDFGDHAQRALTAHHQARQVVARAGLFGAGAGADHLALRRDHFQRQHVFAHGAVAHGVGAAGARGRHAAQRGIGTGVDREKQAGGLDRLIELLARHAGLHRHRQVFGVDGQHLVHAAHIDADAALHRQQMAFERRTDTKRNHRHLELRSQLHGIRHILRAFGKDHGGGRWHAEGRFVPAMLLAHHQGSGILRCQSAPTRLATRRRARGDCQFPGAMRGLVRSRWVSVIMRSLCLNVPSAARQIRHPSIF